MQALTKDISRLTIPTPFLVGPVNCYLIRGEALVLVDTGPKTTEAREALRRQLAENKVSAEDIDLVILTHHHPDHIGLLEEFPPKTKVHAHPKVRPWLKAEDLFFKQARLFYHDLYMTHGVPVSLIALIEKQNANYLRFASAGNVDVELTERSVIDGLEGWSVLETPGHAQSHISLYREADGVMLAGDHLIEHISSNAIIEPPYDGESTRPKTLLQYRNSLKKCRHVKTAYSGHGKEVIAPRNLIQARLAEQEKKAAQFKALMGDQPVTCYDLCVRKYDHVVQKQPALTISETLGHLDLLEEQGEVCMTLEGNTIYYQRV
ncbi:Glyoxylase, beta-lactamase superfamily II [Evansella caseinilytica]|uniref:Glyoxylase, beta-lactamase superfamily II n=1 Tax=Evansella caseinilytica TaxID=1503961 RepID=A0A1H3H1R6_9BACI|nr:MBL fold metallo-hydrolase [Evansella caseinilytica]SDY08589.1 Glyoxylase, beta-lactamase superfamily II [Evansella caseinilytica]